MMPERRHALRIAFNSVSSIRCVALPIEPPTRCATIDLSSLGVRLITSFPPGIKSLIQVDINAPTSVTGKPVAEFRYTGQVMWARPYGTSISEWCVGVKYICFEDVASCSDTTFRILITTVKTVRRHF
jgi:PilZ domain